MKTEETRVTRKYQTTVPKEIRAYLGIRPGNKVVWSVVRSMVFVDSSRKVKEPVKFLTSQIKFDADAVKLVRDVRGEME